MQKYILTLLAVPYLTFANSGHHSLATTSDVQVVKDVHTECIVSLPSPESLQATSVAEPVYLKKLNGTTESKDGKSWKAQVEINYLVRQKITLVATTTGIKAPPPTLKDDTQTLPKSEIIYSHSGDSEVFYGANPRKYVFDSAEKAELSAKKRALIHLQSLKPLLCPETTTP